MYLRIYGVEIFKHGSNSPAMYFIVDVIATEMKKVLVKIYQDGELIYDYTGLTFGFVEGFENHAPKIGVYRDSDPTGQGYPDQTVYYDDFAVVSDKKTLDKLIPEE